jgi:hypothetical protein
MAQSTITVTPISPTPPTNFGSGFQNLGHVASGQSPNQTTPPPTQAGLAFMDDGAAGVVTAFAAPASGAPHEAAGTEVIVVAPGSRPEAPTQSISVLGNWTGSPNGQHASSLTPSVNPALTSIAPDNIAAAAGNQLLTATGTNFTPQSVIYVNGIPQTTTFVSPTSVTATVAKKTTAGTWPVSVVTGGVTTAPQTWTFT